MISDGIFLREKAERCIKPSLLCIHGNVMSGATHHVLNNGVSCATVCISHLPVKMAWSRQAEIAALGVVPASPVISGKYPCLLILSIWKDLFSPTNFLTSLRVKTCPGPPKRAQFWACSPSVDHPWHLKGGLTLGMFHRLHRKYG